MFTDQSMKQTTGFVKKFSAILLAPVLFASTISITEAKIINCKIKVVGGSYKGRSFSVQMPDGDVTGQSDMLESELEGCRVKKQVFGRWYHLCEKGTLIVYKRKNNKWQRLKPKSLKKYQHTCF